MSGFLTLSLTTIVLVGYSLVPSLNAFCHIYGLFTGSLVGYILLIRPRVDGNGNELSRTKGQKILVCLAGAAIFIEMVVFSTLFGLDDVYESCE